MNTMKRVKLTDPRVGCGVDDAMFACLSGQCLPQGLQCDGIQHCDDGSDEIQLCGELINSLSPRTSGCDLNMQILILFH